MEKNINDFEYTYVMIKPDVSRNELCVKTIKQMLESIGMEIVVDYTTTLNPNGYIPLTKKQLEEHYGHVKKYGEDVFEQLVAFMQSDFVIPMVLRGPQAITAVRSLIGPTDSTKADKSTIRGLFGTDKRRNAIHASDSKESAIAEISRFFGGMTIDDLEEYRSITEESEYSYVKKRNN